MSYLLQVCWGFNESFMKKEFNIKNTFIITGIIQALFLALYAIALLLIPFMPTLPPQIHFQFAATLSVIPVMPVCLIWNTLALCYVLDISQKREKEGRKWLYVILSSLIMLVAWVIYIGVWISLTGGV